MKTHRTHKKLTGGSMPIAMMFFMVVGMVTVAAIGVSTTSDSMANRASQKAEATALAEAGVNELYDQVVRDLQAGKNPSNLSSTYMSSAFGGETRQLGSYSAKIVKESSVVNATGIDYTFLLKESESLRMERSPLSLRNSPQHCQESWEGQRAVDLA